MPTNRAVRPATPRLPVAAPAGGGHKQSGISFDIPGTPVGYTRMTQRSKWGARAQRYLTYRSVLSAKAKEAMRGNPPMRGAVAVAIMVFVHKSTFDVDNIIKCCLDGMNEIVYGDDKQVRAVEIEIFEAPDSLVADEMTVIVVPRLSPAEREASP